ncbi:hypothetical protein ACOSYY_08435 [Nitrospira sp. BLG_2]
MNFLLVDDRHKHDHFVLDILGRYVERVPVCPEVEAGWALFVRLCGWSRIAISLKIARKI